MSHNILVRSHAGFVIYKAIYLALLRERFARLVNLRKAF
jgi:hypothetical protein